MTQPQLLRYIQLVRALPIEERRRIVFCESARWQFVEHFHIETRAGIRRRETLYWNPERQEVRLSIFEQVVASGFDALIQFDTMQGFGITDDLEFLLTLEP
jgi:hypothetical protein